MQLYQNTEVLHFKQKNAITVGAFDGVHLGHQKVLKILQDTAKNYHLSSLVLTFTPHPRTILGTQKVHLLTTDEEKIALFTKTGIDCLVLYPFTQTFAAQTANEYIENFLIQKLQMGALVMGYDHHFGKNREGNWALLKKYTAKSTIKLEQIAAHLTEESVVSSSKIRAALAQGDLRFAKAHLGRHYSLQGRVIEGKQLGRTLGFPTANLAIDPLKLLPKEGVYVVKAQLHQQYYFGMMNIGFAPTLQAHTQPKVEVYLFDFAREIYANSLQIECLYYWRTEQHFSSKQALIKQLQTDEQGIRALLNNGLSKI